MLAALITMCLICGCTKKAYHYIEEKPIEATMGSYSYIEPFVEDTTCQHLFVHVAIETEEPDSSISIILNQIGIEQGFICACLYCHKISKCY